MMIKIFLVDDQRLILEGIRAILRNEPEIEIVGSAQNGQSAIAQILKLQPDIVLIDIEMPKMNGIVVTKHICQSLPHTRVIVLTSHKSQCYINRAFQAGASSYITKDSLVTDLQQAIYSLSRGYSYIETKLLNQAVNRIQTNDIQSNNIVRKHNTYIKKYRRNIYIPAVNLGQKSSTARTLKTTPKSSKYNSDINFESPDPDRDLNSSYLIADEATTAAYQVGKKKSCSRQLLRRIIFFLIAIATITLSIVVF
jgi:DNA-binding NarL/FixJ family response regulator